MHPNSTQFHSPSYPALTNLLQKQQGKDTELVPRTLLPESQGRGQKLF